MIFVAGATGFLGGDVCRRLIERGESVRGLVRTTSDPTAVDRLRMLGVERVVGDVRDRASLDRACAGVRTVVSTVTTTRTRQPGDSIEATDQQGQLNLVAAARDAGVQRFVYVSYSRHLDDDGPLTHAKRTVENALAASEMSHVILRPTYFMEVWLSPVVGFDYPNRQATIYGDGESKISFISLGDVAEFVVRAAVDQEPASAAIELGGPDAISPLEVVRIFEELGAAPFAVQRVPADALRTQFEAATDSLQKSFAGLMLDYAHGDEIPMSDTLQKFPMLLTSVRDYARSVLGG
jgi:NADH dehydrogenase